MMSHKYQSIATLVIVLSLEQFVLGATIDFSDVPLAPNSFYNGDPGGSPVDGNYGAYFTSGGITFPNSFNVSFGGSFKTVNGWSASNKVVTPPAPGTYGTNYQEEYLYSVPRGSTGNYATTILNGFNDAPLVLPASTKPVSLQVNNLTYAYLSMRDGDGFAKKFGGVNGTDEDFYLLTVQGLSSSDVPTGSVSYYLANFLGSNTTLVDTWQTVDLTTLGNAAKLAFSVTSSDNDLIFGINTPPAFALDNLVVTAIPEPGTWAMLAGIGVWAIVRAGRRQVS